VLRRPRVILALSVLLLAVGLGSSPAAAQAAARRPIIPILSHQHNGSATSLNWSGYASYQNGTTFTNVKATWTQPAANCPTSKKTWSSFWVGIDGYTSSTVEQIGTESDCTGKNRPSYYAWYEMFPAAPVNLSMTVHPGDSFTGEVSASGSSFTLSLTNNTTGATFEITKSAANAQKSSAEWVAEAPSGCTLFFCHVLPLTDFGKAVFTKATATGDGHNGPINDSAWNNDSIVMQSQSGITKADPSELGSTGNGFHVDWLHT
jgi:peptidase A4-like protein